MLALMIVVEWTQALTKFLHEQLQKVIDHCKGTGPAGGGFLTAGPALVIDVDAAMRQWNYGMLLVQHMYDEGLIDRHEFLSWLIELLEKVKIADDTVLKLILGQVLRVSIYLLPCMAAYAYCVIFLVQNFYFYAAGWIVFDGPGLMDL